MVSVTGTVVAVWIVRGATDDLAWRSAVELGLSAALSSIALILAATAAPIPPWQLCLSN